MAVTANSVNAPAVQADTIVRDFLSIGGRIMLSPDGRYESNIDTNRVLDDETGRQVVAVRRFISAEKRRGGKNHFRSLVRKFGNTKQSGWQVLTSQSVN